MLDFLPGSKTYIVAGLMLIVGAVQVATGDVSAWQGIADNINIFLEGFGLGALRAGIAKKS